MAKIKPKTPAAAKSTKASIDAKAKEGLTRPLTGERIPNRAADGTSGRTKPDGQTVRGYRQSPADEIEPTNTTLNGTRDGQRSALEYPRGHIAG